jgi:uncharacterized protein (UPF0261 family)
MPIMVKGAIKKVTELRTKGELKGLIGVGGTTGTQMVTDIMKSQPFGFPKFAVSRSPVTGSNGRRVGSNL